jgi:hypothetical protein
MWDLGLVLLLLAFFGIAVLLVRGCELVLGRKTES